MESVVRLMPFEIEYLSYSADIAIQMAEDNGDLVMEQRLKQIRDDIDRFGIIKPLDQIYLLQFADE